MNSTFSLPLEAYEVPTITETHSLVIDACVWGRMGLVAVSPAPVLTFSSLTSLIALQAKSPARVSRVVVVVLPCGLGGMIAELSRLAWLLRMGELTSPVLVLSDLSSWGLHMLLRNLGAGSGPCEKVFCLPPRLSPEILRQQIATLSHSGFPAFVSASSGVAYEPKLLTLTPCELLTLGDALTGKSLTDMARARCRSRKTLYSHLQHALQKLGERRLASLGHHTFE